MSILNNTYISTTKRECLICPSRYEPPSNINETCGNVLPTSRPLEVLARVPGLSPDHFDTMPDQSVGLLQITILES